jgi:hypothetical protein
LRIQLCVGGFQVAAGLWNSVRERQTSLVYGSGSGCWPRVRIHGLSVICLLDLETKSRVGFGILEGGFGTGWYKIFKVAFWWFDILRSLYVTISFTKAIEIN